MVLTQVIKEATRMTAETNTLTYYIVTNKDNVADSGIIPCDHDLIYIINDARLPKIKKDPKIVTVRSTKNLNNDRLIKGSMPRSHYRNYGEHKGLAVLNSELSKLSP